MDAAFEVHMLNDDGKAKAIEIATRFDDLLSNLKRLCKVHGGDPTGELAALRAKLEEACFLAKKAMASQAENQE